MSTKNVAGDPGLQAGVIGSLPSLHGLVEPKNRFAVDHSLHPLEQLRVHTRQLLAIDVLAPRGIRVITRFVAESETQQLLDPGGLTPGSRLIGYNMFQSPRVFAQRMLTPKAPILLSPREPVQPRLADPMTNRRLSPEDLSPRGLIGPKARHERLNNPLKTPTPSGHSDIKVVRNGKNRG